MENQFPVIINTKENPSNIAVDTLQAVSLTKKHREETIKPILEDL
jgi:hypothetical protein